MAVYKCTGKTFHAKESLKALGLRWDGNAKCWTGELADDKLDELKQLAMQHNFNIVKNDIVIYGDEQ